MAYTAKRMSWGYGGLCNVVQQLENVRTCLHHTVSARTMLGMAKREKGDFAFEKFDMKCERAGRREQLSGRARLQ